MTSQGTAPEDRPIEDLWDEAARTFAAARRSVPEAEPVVFAIGGTWSAYLDDEATLAPDSPEFEAAGEALMRLAAALPLIHDPERSAAEFVKTDPTPDGAFNLIVQSMPDEEAYVRLILDAEQARDFVTSRSFEAEPRTEWDAARRKRLIRSDVFETRWVIEPGVAWFVEWLEQAGAQTIFSCEGHPQGFHVVFAGSYELAHAMAGAPNAVVDIFRSLTLPEPDRWRLRLDTEPETHDERDDLLRQLSQALAEVTPG